MSPQITKELVVWDPLIRIFHWSLTFFFFLAYLLEGDWPALHSHAGYTVALLIIFRMVWGMIGSMHARFSDFITTPSIALTYFKRLLTSKNETYIGHNPAGAAMILALMTCLLITAFSGISLFAMEGSGPLANTIGSNISKVRSNIGVTPIQKSAASLNHLAQVLRLWRRYTRLTIWLPARGKKITSVNHRENCNQSHSLNIG